MFPAEFDKYADSFSSVENNLVKFCSLYAPTI